MKENTFDLVVDRLLARRDEVRKKLAVNYKRTKPFRSQEIPKQELIDAYSQLSPQDMQMLVQKHGEEKMNQFIADMEQLRDKEVLNAFTKTIKA